MNKYMEEAYKESIKAYKKNEIPVGAVIVYKDKIISKAYNNRQSSYNLLGHAEINAILKAEKKIKDWRLDKCDMYVTLLPCEMCQLLIKESRINNVYYLISNENVQKKMVNITQTNDCIEIKEKYEEIIDNFFKKLRK
jgi:tRNA(adenine34) deaminase